MSINTPSKEFYIHSLIVGIVFLLSYSYFKPKKPENPSCTTICTELRSNFTKNNEILLTKDCKTQIRVCSKQPDGKDSTKSSFFKHLHQLSISLFGKIEPNFLLPLLGVFAYISGILISLISQLLMDIIFQFNPQKLEETLCPFQREKKIELDFNSEENVTYYGSEIFYNLGNFFFSLIISTLLSLLYAKYQSLSLLNTPLLPAMIISILIFICLYYKITYNYFEAIEESKYSNLID